MTYFKSQHSHTVEKWPQPSFLTTWYRLWKRSPIFTGWYPPENNVCIIFFPVFFSAAIVAKPSLLSLITSHHAFLHNCIILCNFTTTSATTLFCSARTGKRIYDSWISDFARFAVLCSCIVQQKSVSPFFLLHFFFPEMFANQWLPFQLLSKYEMKSTEQNE